MTGGVCLPSAKAMFWSFVVPGDPHDVATVGAKDAFKVRAPNRKGTYCASLENPQRL